MPTLPRWAVCVAMAWCFALLACGRKTEPVAEVGSDLWPVVTRAQGRALVEKYECHRCHAGTGLADPPPAKACAGCHQEIAVGEFTVPIAGGKTPDRETLAEWRQHTRHLIHVPDLRGATARLSRAWLAEFLVEPRDLRPHLEETMPRLRMLETDAVKLATHLTQEPRPSGPIRGFANRGRRLLEDKGCTACHQFSGTPPLRIGALPSGLSPAQQQTAMTLAPDLRFARERMASATMVEWIVEPRALQPEALMPNLGVTREEAEHMVAYITKAPLAPRENSPPFERLALLDRPVAFDEVSRAVFRGSCWHCHSDPDYAFGDGGPGNTGGFGFKGKRIELATYEGVVSGYVDAEGVRHSLIADEQGRSLLVESLLARHAEERGMPREAVLGMPLGLPALTAEQIQLVESWVKQGAPP